MTTLAEDTPISSTHHPDGTTAWLTSALGMRHGRAVERLTFARQLERLSTVDKLARTDGLSYGYAATIAGAVSRLDDADAEKAEQILLEMVDDGFSAQQVHNAGRHITDLIAERDGTETPDEDARRGYRRSWLTLNDSLDGGAWLNGWVTPELKALLRAALDPLSKPTGADDPRDHAQRRADALYTLLSEGGGHWQAIVIIDWRTLHTQHPPARPETPAEPHSSARLPDGTPIPPERARQIALAAGVCALILGPESPPLYFGRSRRLVSPAQRKVLLALYQTCAVDGCDIPAELCEIDHVRGWDAGGVTDIDNLVPGCGFHNRFKHEHPGRVTITRGKDGRWRYKIKHPG